MRPFQEFRLWRHRAPIGQRIGALVAVVAVLGLLGWAVVPAVNSSSDSASASAPTTSPGASPLPSVAANASCKPVTGVTGVTDKTIKIGINLTNITGAASNASLGILSYANQKKVYSAMVQSINAKGGIACRQIVPDYFAGNAADQAQLQQNCLAIAQAGVFALVDSGSYASFPIINCFPQHKVPYIGGYTLPTAQMLKFYPYMFEFNSSDSLYHTTVVALKARGFFDPANGFKKLGLVYQSCNTTLVSEYKGWLAAAGVPASSIVSYDVGCPTAFTSPFTLQSAILKFKQEGVTNVTTVGFTGDFPTFSKLAQLQHFNPIYGFADDQIISTSYGSSAPSYPNIANAIAVSQNRNGEDTTSGSVPTAGTAACNKIVASVGLPSVYKLNTGNGCDLMWQLEAMVDHEPSLSQTLLPEGLQLAKSVDFSFPQGPNDWSAGHLTWSGQYYRVNQFHTSCNCWQLVSPDFQRSQP
jgi:hypothetical protein